MSDNAARTRIGEKRVGVVLTKVFLDALDQLVEKGIYLNQQVAIRDALRRLFQLYGIKPFCVELVEEAKLKDNAPSEQ